MGDTINQLPAKQIFKKLSSSDNLRGWHWNGKTASYAGLSKGKTYLYVRSFDGQNFGPVPNDEIILSNQDKIRGWSWDGETASYLAVTGGETQIVIRPFDGRNFKPVSRAITLSSSDNLKEWTWNGKTAAYIVSLNGKNKLITRPFDGKKFGSVTLEIPAPADLRGLSMAGSLITFGSFKNGKTSIESVVFSNATVTAQAFWWGYHFEFPESVMEQLSESGDIIGAFLALGGAIIEASGGILAPFVAIVGAYVGIDFALMKAVDQGKGVYLSAIWISPLLLVPTAITD